MWRSRQSGLDKAFGHHVGLFAVQRGGYLGLGGADQDVKACFIYHDMSVLMLETRTTHIEGLDSCSDRIEKVAEVSHHRRRAARATLSYSSQMHSSHHYAGDLKGVVAKYLL